MTSTATSPERVMQGDDPLAASIIQTLIDQGWQGDRIIKNVATKVFSPNHATVRVNYDAVQQVYWLANAEYWSCGANALAGLHRIIQPTATAAEIEAIVRGFLSEAALAISQTFAVKHLG